MNDKKLKIFLIKTLILVLILLVVFALFSQKENEEPKLLGVGVECFKSCFQICKEESSEIISFGAIDSTCSCYCKNGFERIFKIENNKIK